MLLSELVLSPAMSILQAMLTRHTLMNIYEDVRHSQTGFGIFYKDGRSKGRPVTVLRHIYI